MADSDEEKASFQISKNSLSFALLISNGSVLVVGIVMIGPAFFNLTPKDYAFLGVEAETSLSVSSSKHASTKVQSVTNKESSGDKEEIKKERDSKKGKKKKSDSKSSGGGETANLSI